MGFYVHRSNRVERLVGALAEVLSRPRRSVFEPEQVVVQSRGMERWLQQELARRLGVAMHLGFPFPRALLEGLSARLSGQDELEVGRYRPEVLRWTLAEVLPGLVDRPEFGALARYLEDATDERRRHALCEQIASVFDRYAVYRPDLVTRWEQGAPGGWQAALWRALVARAGRYHPAARAEALWRGLRAPGARAKLPERVSIFGVSSLPPSYLRNFAALGELMDVHLFCLSPTDHHWAGLATRRALLAEVEEFGSVLEQSVEEELSRAHPLLMSLGRSGQEFQRLLEHVPGIDADVAYEAPGDDTLLGRLQGDLLALRARGAASFGGGATASGAAPALAPIEGDVSLRIHACHSPLREVEVLRDQLLEAFARDAALRPEDVVVMTPSIERYAPLIAAVFGAVGGGGEPAGAAAPSGRGELPYRIADRAPRGVEPLYEGFAQLLELAVSRYPLGQVAELLAQPALQLRFGLGAEQVEEVVEALRAAGVRWGQDRRQRQEQGQPELDDNTWRFGIDRLLLGWAMGEEVPVAERAPLPHLDGGRALAFGRVLEVLDIVFELRREVATPRPVAAWMSALAELAERLYLADAASTDTREALASLRRELGDLAEEAALAGFTEPVGFGVIGLRVVERLSGVGTSRGFLSGGITVCAMLPMRSIPFKLVAIVGLNDGEFPRNPAPVDFDELGRAHRLGDRDQREEDRYLFLEALLSVREQLIITYVGRGLRDNAERPPSAVLAELLQTLREGYGAGLEPGQAPPWLVQHPLQPFSPRYFQPGRDPRLFSYAAAEADAASHRSARQRLPFHDLEPAAEAPTHIELSELGRFLERPAQVYLHARLGVTLDRAEASPRDELPVQLEWREVNTLQNSLLERLLEGQPRAAVEAWARASGRCPPGVLGEVALEQWLSDCEGLAQQVKERQGTPPERPLELSLELEGGLVVSGVLAGVGSAARVTAGAHTLNGGRRARLWAEHLALCASGTQTSSLHVCFTSQGDPQKDSDRFSVLELGACSPQEARELLLPLVQLYQEGLRRPLPYFPKASWTYAHEYSKLRKKSSTPPEEPAAGAAAAAGPPAEGALASPEASAGKSSTKRKANTKPSTAKKRSAEASSAPPPAVGAASPAPRPSPQEQEWRRRAEALDKALTVFEGDGNDAHQTPERAEPATELLWRGQEPIAELRKEAAAAPLTEFERCARLLFGPLLELLGEVG